MPVRLFTSGTHQSMSGAINFSNDQVQQIFTETQKTGLEQIPFVLGHPKNNLPIVGWLPKSAIKTYTEGDKISLGFDRSDADLSEDSMSLIREQGSNKISVRLENGVIRHIGLVKKAAVEENNAQNFSQAEMTGVFSTAEDILEKQQTDFSKLFNDLKNEVKSIFKSINMGEKNKEENPQNVDLSAINQLTQTVGTLQQTLSGFMNQTKATADFSADEFKNMTAEQKKTAAGICADLGEEKATALKGLLKELAKPAVTVKNGSIVNDFGKPADELKTVGDIVRAQMGGGQ